VSRSSGRPSLVDDEALIAAISQAARRVAAVDVGEGPEPTSWHRLQKARTAVSPGVGRRWARPLLVALGTLALVSGAITLLTKHPLTYTVVGGGIGGGSYIRGVGEAGTDVQFSEGTRIHLRHGSRMSVVSPSARGARLRVEEGEVHFEVAHLPGADWTVEAGPYQVRVTGTVFDVRWSGADESVEVRLRSGSVRVSGPLLSDPVTLRPGQRLASVLASREMRIEDGQDEASPPPTLMPLTTNGEKGLAVSVGDKGPAVPVKGTPNADGGPQSRRESVAAAHPVSLPRSTPTQLAIEGNAPVGSDWDPEDWASRLATNDSASVVAQAKQHGIDRTLAEVEATELAVLADAARYVGDRELAGRALQEERRRFPDTAPAQAAAFFLGRMAEDLGDAAAGLAWYRSYLTEAPRGPFAAEAMGREMLTVEHLFGRVAASAVAREYLRRFPGGTYLHQARSILDAP
jgi:hypothetical protein